MTSLMFKIENADDGDIKLEADQLWHKNKMPEISKK